MQLGGYTKKERMMRLVICIASTLLLLVLFIHQDSCKSSWQQKFRDWRTGGPSEGAESMKLQLSRLVRGEHETELESSGFSCISETHTDQCVITKPVIFDKQSLTLYIPFNHQKNPPTKKSIKPYARKDDQNAMDRVSPVQILHGNMRPPVCQFTHNVPGLVFSFGGFTENIFHDFNEVIIPLFITSRHFGSRVQFVITDYRARWVRKFIRVLKELSKYDIIDADADETVHCFPSAVVGLRYHDNLALNNTQIPGGYTIANFRQFLRDSFNLKLKTILKPKKPKLLLLSRQKSRKILNEDEMVKMMEQLGFQVQIALPSEMSKLGQFAQIVNSCDMMVGAHGAGLTNEIFLPNGAVVVQIVPLGLEWGSEHYYARPAVDMGLNYLDYKIQPNESSLYQLYGPNDPIISDPAAIWAKGYRAVKDVYLDQQDFRINISRFKDTLVEALELLG